MLMAFIREGGLTIVRPNGKVVHVGEHSDTQSSPEIILRLKSSWTAFKIAMQPDLYFGEAYMDGSLVLEKGTLWDLLDLCGRNLVHRRLRRQCWAIRVFRLLVRQFQQHNSRRTARRNVAHHYDLSDSLFRSFLDQDMQYSCAYFLDPRLSLDEAQAAKKWHVLGKLLLEPGHRVLDIGCGWGGLAISIAEAEGVSTTAITLSREQLVVAIARARDAGVDHKIAFEAKDYREIAGPFDRIVSVGMFEHVGKPNYQVFFDKIASLLTNDGVALIHSIGRTDGPGLTQAWTRKYIFPGGYIPALSEVLPAVERAGFWVTDIEILRLHYAETLRAWRNAFLDKWDVVRATYDERFCRMWEFYLAGSEMAFRYDGLMVFQMQLAKRVDTVPITRNYMFEHERFLGKKKSGSEPAVDLPLVAEM
ncbi:MAG TPA: cyclopropane-fatty-acyl-phospholipid synthase family protein [Stellaceae bacterium]|nr:cyclopropane-fatty-acyl-phospholipid synthase family protein [Stellaceae bacterium]